jgi:hypothetical protein
MTVEIVRARHRPSLVCVFCLDCGYTGQVWDLDVSPEYRALVEAQRDDHKCRPITRPIGSTPRCCDEMP